MPTNAAVASAWSTSRGARVGTTSRMRFRPSQTFTAQPTSAPAVAASTRGTEIGAALRRPSSSMKTTPTSGRPISAAMPAAPPPTAAERTNFAQRGPVRSKAVPAATPRCAAGDSVPIGAPRPTVARMATARIGASRHGKSSSWPAVRTTSAVRSARTTSAGKRSQAPNPVAPAGRGARASTRWRASPCATCCRMATARPTPASGARSSTQPSWRITTASSDLISWVTVTTNSVATTPPASPPATLVATRLVRVGVSSTPASPTTQRLPQDKRTAPRPTSRNGDGPSTDDVQRRGLLRVSQGGPRSW